MDDATAPVCQVIVEMLNDDVFTFSPEDLGMLVVGDVLGRKLAETLDEVAEAMRDPDAWLEFAGATFRKADHDWEEDGPPQYSRATIFGRNVSQLVVVYDEPARMDIEDIEPEWA